MRIYLKYLSIIFLSLFVAQNTLAETFHFYRPYKNAYSLTKASININGVKKVVASEAYVNFSVNGAYTIVVDGHGIFGAQMKKSKVRGTASGSGNKYFLVSVRENIISKFVITETSKQNFDFARGQSN
tara:strand:- start:223 stop:606 length:384 start_codon:yes stop_codon:yes gene_type:complete